MPNGQEKAESFADGSIEPSKGREREKTLDGSASLSAEASSISSAGLKKMKNPLWTLRSREEGGGGRRCKIFPNSRQGLGG